MPTATYTPIASVTLSASASEVVFSGLPQTYRDLILVFTGLGTSNDVGVQIRYNGDSGANYSNVVMSGFNPSNTGSGTPTTTAIQAAGWQVGIGTSGERTTFIAQIMDYSATDKHKTSLIRARTKSDGGGDEVSAWAGRWANTTAISSIRVATASGSIASGATLNLFGVIA